MPSPKYVYGAIRGRAFLHRASARKGTANRGASDNLRHGLKPASKRSPEIQSAHRHLPAMSLAFDPEDFSFVVKMRGAPAKPWVWEIHRAGKSGPVERSPVCYASMAGQPEREKKP